MANTKGEVQFRQHLRGEYPRGLPDGEVMCKKVAEADAAGPAAPFGAAQKRQFMEGFRAPGILQKLEHAVGVAEAAW